MNIENKDDKNSKERPKTITPDLQTQIGPYKKGAENQNSIVGPYSKGNKINDDDNNTLHMTC